MPEGWAISSIEPLPQRTISGTPAPPGTENPLSADDITLQKCKWVVAIRAPGKGREERARSSGCSNRQQHQGPAPSRTQDNPGQVTRGLWTASSQLSKERLDLGLLGPLPLGEPTTLRCFQLKSQGASGLQVHQGGLPGTGSPGLRAGRRGKQPPCSEWHTNAPKAHGKMLSSTIHH